jgi:hypothetical protein
VVVVRRGGGLGLPCSDGPMGQGRGLVRFGWRLGAVRAASLSTRLVRLRVLEVRSGCYVGAAAPGSARRSWSAGSWLGSGGYKTARSCGIVARVRFVPSGVSRGGGPGAGGVFLWRTWPSVVRTTGPRFFGCLARFPL